jgi:hypothetical protein
MPVLALMLMLAAIRIAIVIVPAKVAIGFEK